LNISIVMNYIVFLVGLQIVVFAAIRLIYDTYKFQRVFHSLICYGQQ